MIPLASAQQPQPQTPYGGVLKIGIDENLDTLNPYSTLLTFSEAILRDMYDTMVTWNPQMQYVPELAQSWDQSPDGLTWTFHIQHNVTWQDGVPFTSADIKFTIQDIALNMGVPIPHGLVSMVQSVETPDNYTVILHLQTPTSVLLYNLACLFIVPQHIWGNLTSKDQVIHYSNLPVIGDGAFKFVEWVKGQYVRLQANQNYWRGRPYVDEVWFVQYASSETELAALRTGEIDAMPSHVGSNEVNLVNADPNLKVDISSPLGFIDIYFAVYENTTAIPPNPALRDVRVRQAFLRSIDKNSLNAIIHNGLYTPGLTGVPPGCGSYFDPNLGNEVNMTFDLNAAANMLDAAGYRDIDNSGIRQATQDIKLVLDDGTTAVVPKGTKLDFGFEINTEFPEEVRAAEMINQWLHQVGMNIRITTADGDVLGSQETPPFPYDIQLWDWNSRFDPDFILSVYTTGQIGGWSSGGWSNPQYDQLYNQQRQALDPTQRQQIIYNMEKILYTEVPELPLYYYPTIGAHRIDKFTGWLPAPLGGILSGTGLEGYPRTTTSVHLIYAPVSASATTTATTEQPSTLPLAAIAVPILVIIALLGYVVYLKRKKGPP